jgi:hypothetical protein
MTTSNSTSSTTGKVVIKWDTLETKKRREGAVAASRLNYKAAHFPAEHKSYKTSRTRSHVIEAFQGIQSCKGCLLALLLLNCCLRGGMLMLFLHWTGCHTLILKFKSLPSNQLHCDPCLNASLWSWPMHLCRLHNNDCNSTDPWSKAFLYGNNIIHTCTFNLPTLSNTVPYRTHPAPQSSKMFC